MAPSSFFESELLQLVGLIYDAAVERSVWPEVLARIAQITHSASAALLLDLPGDHEAASTPEWIEHGLDPEFTRLFAEHYWQHDPWAGRMSPRDRGLALPGRAVLGLRELRTTGFYADCWKRFGYLDSFSVSLRFRGSGLTCALSGVREERAGEYKDHELERLQPLGPHLERAIAIDARLSAARTLSGTLTHALDRLEVGVLMIDDAGRVLQANSAAERLLAAADGLYAPLTGVGAADARTTRELRRLLGEASRTGAGAGLAAGGWLRLPRPSGRPDLIAMITPARAGESGVLHARTVALVFVTDPESRPPAGREALRRIWPFTHAEADLAYRLMAGLSLQQSADLARVSRNTAKSHLASVFAKTGTHRQGELIALLARTVGVLDDGATANAADPQRPEGKPGD